MPHERSPIVDEIDYAGATAFRDGLYERVDQSDTPIVHLDLAAVTFIDSAGYHALADATEYAHRRGRVLLIQNLGAFPTKLLQLCDWDRELHLEGSARI